MKISVGATLVCLATIYCCGCASARRESVYHAGDEKPPEFLVGPVAAVLTNLNGFSAHVVAVTTSPELSSHTRDGLLLERDGMLIFQPTLKLKGKRKRTEGGLFFIWDQSKRSGYVLSEALQGYAPIVPDSESVPQGPASISRQGIVGDVNGHPCHRYEAVVPLENGLQARLILWGADDAGHFPVRIEWSNGANLTTLNFSDLRMTYPARDLFLPPDGFTSYISSVSLMNELIVREASIKQTSESEFQEPGDTRENNWRPQITGSGSP